MKYISLTLLFCALALAAPQQMTAQDEPMLTGVVHGVYPSEEGGASKDVHKALAGANIYWQGTNIGTVSRPDGAFALERIPGYTALVVSHVAFERDTIEVPEDKLEITVMLDRPLTLEGVDIAGDGPDTYIDEAAVINTEVISAAELEKAACCNLSESFETNVAVDVGTTDAVSGAKRIQLLGLDGVYTQIITENIPSVRGLATPFGLEYTPGPWLESIAVSKGAASVMTGYESITGQINVQLRQEQPDDPLYVNMYSNGFGRFEANLAQSLSVTDRLSTTFLAHGNYLDNEVDRNSDAFVDIPRKGQFAAFNRWAYVGDRFETRFGGGVMLEDRSAGEVGFTNSNGNLYGFELNTERYELFAKGGVSLAEGSGRSLAFLTTGSHHSFDGFIGRRDYVGTQSNFNGRAVLVMPLDEDSQHLSIGASLLYDNIEETFDGATLAREEVAPGVLAEYELKPDEMWTIVAGIRADAHNLYGTFVTPRLHVRFKPDEFSSLRFSAGTGMRTANVFAENMALMASSRDIVIEESLRPERALNVGVAYATAFEVGEQVVSFNTEFFRTEFSNQVVINTDRDPQKVFVSNLDGDSYANSFLVQVSTELFSGLETTVAYRWNDVFTTIDGELLEAPLQSPHKGFVNFSYQDEAEEWQVDATVVIRSGGRLPSTASNPEQYQLEERFPAYGQANMQITRRFELLDFYIGVENLNDYRQEQPVLAADDPYGPYFDSSMVWGPIQGRTIYAGLRYNLPWQ